MVSFCVKLDASFVVMGITTLHTQFLDKHLVHYFGEFCFQEIVLLVQCNPPNIISNLFSYELCILCKI